MYAPPVTSSVRDWAIVHPHQSRRDFGFLGILDSVHQLARFDAEALCQPKQCREGRHPVAPLDVRNECRMKTCRLGQRLLRNPSLLSNSLKASAKGDSDFLIAAALSGGHRRESQ